MNVPADCDEKGVRNEMRGVIVAPITRGPTARTLSSARSCFINHCKKLFHGRRVELKTTRRSQKYLGVLTTGRVHAWSTFSQRTYHFGWTRHWRVALCGQGSLNESGLGHTSTVPVMQLLLYI